MHGRGRGDVRAGPLQGWISQWKAHRSAYLRELEEERRLSRLRELGQVPREDEPGAFADFYAPKVKGYSFDDSLSGFRELYTVNKQFSPDRLKVSGLL